MTRLTPILIKAKIAHTISEMGEKHSLEGEAGFPKPTDSNLTNKEYYEFYLINDYSHGILCLSNLLEYFKLQKLEPEIYLAILHELKDKITRNAKWVHDYNGHISQNQIPHLKFDYEDCLKTHKIILDYLQLEISVKTIKTNKHETKHWFKVGIKLADGTIDSLLDKGLNYVDIARELGNPNFRPYISESYSDLSKSDKNIFNKKEKTEVIMNYCKSNNIPITNKFLKKVK